MEDIQYHIYVRQRIERGLEDIEAGRTISEEEFEVKGQRTPVRVYKMIGRRRWRSRLEMSAERGLTPLVGRQRALALLHDCLTRAEGGRGQVVGIVGEASV